MQRATWQLDAETSRINAAFKIYDIYSSRPNELLAFYLVGGVAGLYDGTLRLPPATCHQPAPALVMHFLWLHIKAKLKRRQQLGNHSLSSDQANK